VGVTASQAARIVAALGLLIAGGLLIFLAPFLFIPLGPFIAILLVVGAFLLREAIRLWRVAPTGRTMAAMLTAGFVTWYLATGEGDGPPVVPIRAIASTGLAASLIGAALVVRARGR
jgi:hypothetical protein